ncbi:MAG: hypothetical protein GY927_23175 [bacterium]|nr:hypothetical protein [bacterium]
MNKPTNSRGVYRSVSGLTTGQLSFALIWLAFAMSGLVFVEPAPFDGLMIGLAVLLPLVGLVRLSPSLVILLTVWLTIFALGMIAAVYSPVPGETIPYMFVSLFLSIISVVIAAFVMVDPSNRVRLIFSGYMFAALLTAVLAIIGYFELVPGAYDNLTRYGRAKATFKDPNVMGPFLTPVVLYLIYRIISGHMRQLLLLGPPIMLLVFAIFISFSRGAWINLAASLVCWAYLYFVTTQKSVNRLKLIALAGAGLIVIVVGVGFAMQSKTIGTLLESRVVLIKDYDNNRFAGQAKALDLILHNPLGIGASHFNKAKLHPEEVHNVYLTMFLNAGWAGGFLYLYLIAMTLARGLQQCLIPVPSRGVFIAVYASFIGVVIEGVVIDNDHWRHFYVLIGLLWGMMASAEVKHQGIGLNVRQDYHQPINNTRLEHR